MVTCACLYWNHSLGLVWEKNHYSAQAFVNEVSKKEKSDMRL